MKNMILAILALCLANTANAAIAEISVDPGLSKGLYIALVNAGARPKGPATISQSLLVIDIKCSSGFNEMTKKADSGCTLREGDKDISVSGETAAELTSALIKAQLISRGAGEISGGSVRSISCI